MLTITKFSSPLASATIALLLAFCPAGSARAQSAKIVASSPKDLPALVYLDHGKKKTISASGHKLTAVHFWATWCAPCIEELPEVDSTLKAYQDKGLQILALSLDSPDAAGKVKQFFADHGITALKPYFDKDLSSFQAIKGRGLPTTLFMDENGKEIGRAEGAMEWNSEASRQFIESHLK